jgi:carbamoyltransferase
LKHFQARGARESVEEWVALEWPDEEWRGNVHYVEHHLAHLGSAFLNSSYAEAVVASVDGFGDFASAAWGLGRGTSIDVSGRVYFPHSLGIFYEGLTQYLGFPNYGDEYKVMGLASYGQPRYLAQMREIVRLKNDGTFRLNLDFFRHHVEKTTHVLGDGTPAVHRLFSQALEAELGPARGEHAPLEERHMDIARSAQAMYEEAFFHLLAALHSRYQLDTLALAGGCAMNSVANGKITKVTPFREVYVHAAPGDAGGAVGAAMVVWSRLIGNERNRAIDHAFWGPAYGDQEIGDLLDQHRDALREQGCAATAVTDETELCERTAQSIAAGRVIGWFQGRMEWGPRALGNRSILADPRRSDMKVILNEKIKRRESFRPFAPSILREAVGEWFETDDDVPFMEKVFVIREEKRGQIPAVVHVDGTGRLQTVTKQSNSRYYRLIETFSRLTGVPMLLNTSFNENEPIVCRPEEALDCFLRTRMDVLVLGNWYLERTGSRD